MLICTLVCGGMDSCMYVNYMYVCIWWYGRLYVNMYIGIWWYGRLYVNMYIGIWWYGRLYVC